MGTGAITWACLLLSMHQSLVQEYFIPQRGFEFPIRLDPKRAAEVQDVILLVSQDKGETWQQADRKKPSERAFSYRAPSDGRFWFIIQEVNAAGRATPANPARARPNQSVIVDTRKPEVQLTAERLPSSAVEARWTIVEDYPDAHSVRLDYHTDAMPDGQWTPLGNPTSLQGKQEFDPGQAGKTGAVRVRVQMKDQAGNVGVGEAVVPAMAGFPAGTPAAAPTETPSIGLIPTMRSEPTAPINQLSSRQTPLLTANPVPQGPSAGGLPLAPTPPNELGRAGSVSDRSLPGRTPLADAPGSPPGVAADTSAGMLPKVQIVNKREVRLDFTVAKVGPSGLGAADVYVTLDKGASWQKMPKEVPISLPPSAELYGPKPVDGSVSVQLQAEGTMYGFIVAVKSKAGLAPPPPKAGDPPEVLVEMDTTVPKAQMYRPVPDTNQPNTLLLGWNAMDRNLGENPVTLEWAERKEGPWTIIGGGSLPNTGQYPWHLPERLPPRVFLRLTVRDVAGNEARAQTDKPELIDLSVPQTKLIRVVPAVP
jgi:hypothetical protein